MNRIMNDPDITAGLTDEEMTKRFQEAVRIEIEKNRIRGLPVVKYDAVEKKPYYEYPDGKIEYAI